ncbi:DUF1212-domain-containing protein [Dentipellis sp. KUC8613]|nr:DUF1212-domain-containing protein [Dentipellis sp. KUC8613]
MNASLPQLNTLPRTLAKGVEELGRGVEELGRGVGLGESRPPKERSAAGVFGPLIASTGSIMAAAAPVNSTVAPSVKRPGYHLSRYSLEVVPTRASQRPEIPRPRSMHFERQSESAPASAPAGLDYRRTQSFDVPRGAGAGDSTGHTSSNGSGERAEDDSGGAGTPQFGEPPQPPRFPPGTFAAGAPSLSSSHFAHSNASTGTFTPRQQKWTDFVRELPKRGWGSRAGTPGPSTPGTPETEEGSMWEWDGGKERDREKERERKREKKRKRKKEEIYITRHVAEIIQRQEFILKLARAMMMFGGPSHRLQAQIQSTARVLELELSCLYLPDVMLISFDDSVTSTSNIKFIRQSSALDLGKLKQGYTLYWKVIHDEISVKDASTALDELMRKRPLYNSWAIVFFGGMSSASICSVSFKGSFIDCLISFPLGALLVFVQLLSVRNELYSNVFEITIATLLSFLSAALASTHKFCYSAVASSSVVLILPGFIVLCGSLELSSRNIVSGAVRLCYALVYSLFLGFGLAIGAEVYQKATNKSIVGPEDYNCVQSHSGAPWYQQTPSLYWAFLTVPMFSLFLSLRNQAPWNKKEIIVCVLVSCIGWVTNHFTGTKFPNQNDISAAVGAFAVGIVANIYGRFFRGNAFVVMITGILFQLPSGLGNGGLLTFAQQQTSGAANSYLSGFQTALQLISVSIGLTVGLGIALVITHPIQSRKRQGGVFSL